jgi:predicted house-cleaning NTP pyrophosphatase (Maf/HAM1 superfamily)
MENQNRTSNVDEKLRKLKIEGIKNVSLLSFPKAKTIDTLLYVDDSILTVKTVVNIDGKLEIFIEKSGEN